jgi:hypothetical protein
MLGRDLRGVTLLDLSALPFGLELARLAGINDPRA